MVMTVHSQTNLTKQQWQEDLRFLQKTIHNDYPFLFKKITKDTFDAKVEALNKEIPNLQEHEIIVGLGRLVSSFKYGHTVLGFRHHPNFHQFPFNLYHFNDGVYVQGVHKDYKDALGAKVIAIGDMTIEEALKAVYPVVPSENDQFFKAYGVMYLSSPEVLHAQKVIKELSESVELTLEKDGKSFKQIFKVLPNNGRAPVEYSLIQQNEDWLDARNQDNVPHYLKHLDKIYYYEYLPEQKTVYVRQSQVQDDPSEDIPTFYNKVFDFIDNNDVEKLIIDVRLNGGGNNYKNKPVITGIIKSEKINKVGHLFVIIGRRTFSACQNLVNEMSNYTNAIFIGEPTSENINFYGDNNRVELPNSKISAYLSFAWWQDKPQWEGADWLAPHIAVDMSFEEYKTNKDPVLETTLTFNEDNFVLDPMQYFTNLFMKGEIDKLKMEAKRMIGDPNYRFFNFESKFNQAGYQLMESNQIQEAIFVFQMITEFFPNSANAWDSLAEGFLKAGDKEKAKAFYTKAMELDANGRIGKHAQDMLNSINDN